VNDSHGRFVVNVNFLRFEGTNDTPNVVGCGKRIEYRESRSRSNDMNKDRTSLAQGETTENDFERGGGEETEIGRTRFFRRPFIARLLDRASTLQSTGRETKSAEKGADGGGRAHLDRDLNLNLARYPRASLLNAETLPSVSRPKPRVDRSVAPLSLAPARPRRKNFTLSRSRSWSVIDASICVSATPGEMTNVAISPGRKPHVSIYLTRPETRYVLARPRRYCTR